MQLKRDYFEDLIVPDFVLCKANRERIGIIPCIDKQADFNFGDMNEISFKTYYMMDGELNPVYDDIDIMKYVLVPGVGFYYIQSCSTQSEGTEHEYKDVKGQSIEGLLGQKYLENFLINTGETGSKELEYDSTGNTHIQIYLSPSQKVGGKWDLFDYILEKCPDWYVAYCDPALLVDERSHRSFDIDRQDVYSFIMNDVQEAFECYVIFDTINLDSKGRCGIYIYAQENYQNDTDIYVSYDNLLQSTNISTDTDDIKTCVVLKGKDELEIREVNFGYDRLYNFDYYNNTDFWSQRLYDEYNQWYEKTYTEGMIVRSPSVYTKDISDSNLADMSYLDLYEYRLQKYLEAKGELDDINNLTSSFVNDDDRTIGSGEFPVFDNDGNEVGSIKFDTDTGVRVTQSLPSSPYSGETNYIYIIKKINSTLNVDTLRAKQNAYKNAQAVQKEITDPISLVENTTIFALQNKFVDTVNIGRKDLINELKNLQKSGSVDLLNRPAVDTKLLELAGWGKQDPGIATVYTCTYTNEDKTIAMNFTPIKVNNKDILLEVMSPEELEGYAKRVIRDYEREDEHYYNDNKHLKIGKTYTGINCVSKATQDAERIHELHEQYFGSGAYWTYFDKNVQYDKMTKVKNVEDFKQAILDEKRVVQAFIEDFEEKKRRNETYEYWADDLDYDKYNDAKKRLNVLKSTDISRNIIKWKPAEKIYWLSNTIGQALIAADSSYQSMLTKDNTKNRFIINNYSQYQNKLHKDLDTVANQIQVTLATSTVSYPGYQIYRWFDNTDMLAFYNALVATNNQYQSSGSVSVANATALRDHNPLYNTCLIIGSNYVTINDPEKFEEYLEADLEEQTALKTKFPTSTWFNTNDWQGYGYSELSDTWALSIDQSLSTMSQQNCGSVPSAYKNKETDTADFKCQSTSAEDSEDPYNYFGRYLPTYLTQLAIEEKIAGLDKQINGYDTYPYPINSKGSIYFEKLPSTHARGDTYTISNRFTLNGVTYPAGTNVTWNGSKWVVTSSLVTHVDGVQDEIDKQAKYKAQVVAEIELDNNLSEASRIELSSFIREEELSSDNFVVTDTMTEEERSEMLLSFVEYGKKELTKVAVPQLSFTANIVNLFSIPEFDNLAEDFEPGKTIYVCIRDDYHVRAMLLNVHINYYDPTDFSMSFSDVLKRKEGLYTDLQDAINTATSAATSVALGSSTWTSGAATASRIYTTLEEGLLSQGAYLSDNPAKSTFEISDIGIFVDTASGDYGRYDVLGEEKFVYDSIYIGGGRILFTDDGWKHVRMSLGRSKVKRIASNGATSNSEEFGVFADFCIAGYVGGSQICGGELFSSAFCNNGTDPITYFNLDQGTFVLRNKSNNQPVLTFNGSALTIGGYATSSALDAETTARKNADTSLGNTISSNYTTLDGKITTVDGKFVSYTTTKALDDFFKGTDTQTFTTINGGVINTGFIHSNNNNSWINLKDGTFNFGGGNGTGSSNPNAAGFIAWNGTTLSVKGNITADSGKIADWTINGSTLVSKEYVSGDIKSKITLDGKKAKIDFGGGVIYGSTFSSNILFLESNQINLDGLVTCRDKLYVDGASNLYGTVYIGDNLTLQSNLSVRGNISTSGTISTSNTITVGAGGAQKTISTSTSGFSIDITGHIVGGAGYCYVGAYGFNPDTTEVINCGGGEHKWKQVFAKEGTINTSDRRYKKNIDRITEPYEKLFFDLEPVKYEFYDGDRIHIGYISQDVETALYKNDLTAEDFAGFCHDVIKTENDDEVEVYDQYALRYSEFIALNTHMIQKAFKRIEELEAEIERLKQ